MMNWTQRVWITRNYVSNPCFNCLTSKSTLIHFLTWSYRKMLTWYPKNVLRDSLNFYSRSFGDNHGDVSDSFDGIHALIFDLFQTHCVIVRLLAWCHILGEKNVSTHSPNPMHIIIMQHLPYIQSGFVKNAEKAKAKTIRSICNPYKKGYKEVIFEEVTESTIH